MKRLLSSTVLSILFILVMALPAQAATLHVTARATAHSTGGASFTARTSRPSRVRVTVYKGKKAIRTIYTRKSGSKYIGAWNQRDAKGALVTSGTYAFKVTAVASRLTRTVRGKVRVTTPAPAPTPAGASAGRWLGYYAQGNSVTMAPLEQIESAVGTRSAVVNIFVGDDEPFPVTRLNNIRLHGSTPMLTWEFASLKGVGLDGINNGSKDAYISAFAAAARQYGGTIMLRPFWEMNGDWDPWDGTVGNNTTAKFVTAWKRVHDLVVAQGATNVKFVWCVNDNSCPGTAANAIENYWPGDAYVDYTAIDIYNFGTTQSWGSHWTPFANAFAAPYKTLTTLSNKPLVIAEVGCVEQGGSKAAWIADMAYQIKTNFPKVTGVCWFNVNDSVDWRVDSSQSSRDAFKVAFGGGF